MAIICGCSEEAGRWAKMLLDFDFDIQILFNSLSTDVEKRKWWEECLGDRLSSGRVYLASKADNWAIKRDRKVSLFIAGSESFEENEILLSWAIYAEIPLRGSVTPTPSANFSLPYYRRNKEYCISVQDGNIDFDSSNLLLSRPEIVRFMEEFTHKSEKISRVQELIKKDTEEFERVEDLAQSLYELDSSEIDSLIEILSKKVEKTLVIGVSDTSYHKLKLEKLCKSFLKAHPEWSFKIMEVDVLAYSDHYFNTDYNRWWFSDFIDETKAAYEVFALLLLQRKIDLAYISPAHFYYSGEWKSQEISKEVTSGLSCTANNTDFIKDFVVLNKYGFESLDSIPERSRFLYEDFDVLPQLKASKIILSDHSDSASLTFGIEEYLEDSKEDTYKDFIIFSRDHLNLLGYSDEALKEMGLTVIDLNCAHPLGYGEMEFLYRTKDPLAVEFLSIKENDYDEERRTCFNLEKSMWEYWTNHKHYKFDDKLKINVKRIDEGYIQIIIYFDYGWRDSRYFSDIYEAKNPSEEMKAAKRAIDEAWKAWFRLT